MQARFRPHDHDVAMRAVAALEALEAEVRCGCVASPSMQALHVVVAHYRSSSYEPLVSALAPDASWVYDKSERGLGDAPTGTVVRRVANHGRESESYLRHICENYDCLAEHTLFVQDDCHVHVPQHHAAAFVEEVRDVCRRRLPGRMLQVCFRGKRREPARRVDASGLGELRLHAELSAACERFGIGLPASYETHVCAFFVASRECIRRRPRRFWQALHAWHAEEASVARRRKCATSEQLAPWLLEHLWELILFRRNGA